MRVPRIRSRMSLGRRESDKPTYVILGMAFAIGFASAWGSNSLGIGTLAAIASYILLGMVYVFLACLYGWPRLRWGPVNIFLDGPL